MSNEKCPVCGAVSGGCNCKEALVKYFEILHKVDNRIKGNAIRMIHAIGYTVEYNTKISLCKIRGVKSTSVISEIDCENCLALVAEKRRREIRKIESRIEEVLKQRGIVP